jgi:hypothetical protein
MISVLGDLIVDFSLRIPSFPIPARDLLKRFGKDIALSDMIKRTKNEEPRTEE